MKTFCIQTLGCKVNHYESEQLISLLRSRGLVETSPETAELRIINSCSVTVQAASQSRQTTRRMVRLPVILDARPLNQTPGRAVGFLGSQDVRPLLETSCSENSSAVKSEESPVRPRVLVVGCWATSDK